MRRSHRFPVPLLLAHGVIAWGVARKPLAAPLDGGAGVVGFRRA